MNVGQFVAILETEQPSGDLVGAATGTGTAAGTLALQPDVTAVVPDHGPAGITVSVAGSNFASGAVVKWDGVDLTTTFVSSTELTVTVPSGTAETSIDVRVTNPGGLYDELADAFTYDPAEWVGYTPAFDWDFDSTYVTTDGGIVTAVTDRSGSGRNLSGGSLDGPAYIDTGPWNGHNAAEAVIPIIGHTIYMTASGIGIASNGAYSILIVFSNDNGAAGNRYYLSIGDKVGFIRSGSPAIIAWLSDDFSATVGESYTLPDTPPESGASAFIYGVTRASGTSSVEQKLYNNGSLVDTQTNATTCSDGTVYLANYSTPSNGNTAHGQIVRVIGFARKLTGTEVTNAHAALAAKYGF